MTKKSGSRGARVVTGLLLLALPLLAAAVALWLGTAVTPVQAQQSLTVGFTVATSSVNENSGLANVTVQLTGVTTTTTVLVDFRTTNGTARSGSDYIAETGTLVFENITSDNDPDAEQTISIGIIDDPTTEDAETFVIVLESPRVVGNNSTINFDIDSHTVTINANDVSAGITPTPVFSDAYEPNNTLPESYTTAADATALCNATLWPTGDVDYYRFSGKTGSRYRVFTRDLSAGLDTVLTVYNTQGVEIGSNDDSGGVGVRASEFFFTANADGFYYARITNKDPSDPTNKTYCFEVDTVAQLTPTPSRTPIAGDICEFNSTIQYACEIGINETLSLNFVPVFGSTQDTDVFRLWMKPGILYTCETDNLSPVADTNIIFLDANGNDFQPNLGNDDKAPGDYGSKLSVLSTYTGWLYIMVGPVNPVPYEEASQHTYQLTCTSTAATPTPTATATSSFSGGTGGTGGSFLPTATPFVFPTFPPTPTPIDLSIFASPTPAPPPVVQFQPLPTATPVTGAQQPVTVNITLYYDTNLNYTPELNEGIMDVAVALYDNATGQLISFGYTNEAGMIRFDSVTAGGAVRVVVPFLNYSQVVVGSSENILLRVAPQPLPIGIP